MYDLYEYIYSRSTLAQTSEYESKYKHCTISHSTTTTINSNEK